MDREKVLKGLERHGKGGSQGCRGCPYELTHGCQLILCHDAIALLKEYELYIQHQKDGYAELEAEYNKLLKEQEPKLVRIDEYSVHCPSCGNELFTYPRQKFCDECGQAVKWDADD